LKRKMPDPVPESDHDEIIPGSQPKRRRTDAGPTAQINVEAEEDLNSFFDE
jgi:hypothetical protein